MIQKFVLTHNGRNESIATEFDTKDTSISTFLSCSSAVLPTHILAIIIIFTITGAIQKFIKHRKDFCNCIFFRHEPIRLKTKEDPFVFETNFRSVAN